MVILTFRSFQEFFPCFIVFLHYEGVCLLRSHLKIYLSWESMYHERMELSITDLADLLYRLGHASIHLSLDRLRELLRILYTLDIGSHEGYYRSFVLVPKGGFNISD